MSDHNEAIVPESLFQVFERDQSPLEEDKLKSRVIAAYEQALDQGLTPSRALAAMLSWVAEESTRLRDAAVD
jgi:hypothetical protein